MEYKPVRINMGDESLELTPKNTAIVRYIARYAIHNHIKLNVDGKDGYIFRECEGSDKLNAILEDRSYPMAIHVPEPSEEVIQQHYELLQQMSEADGEDLDEEVEKWRRLFEN